MDKSLYIQIFTALITLPVYSCWQYYSRLSDTKVWNPKSESMVIHSEYTFGKCKTRGYELYTRVHVNHMSILGKVISRGWIDVPRIPQCIRLNAYSYPENRFQTTGYAFQMCVPRISYSHGQRRFLYYYYEWYLPWDFSGGMDWEILFYGPPGKEWWVDFVEPDN